MKPILFNTEMVCAILAGRKTVTRRVVKPKPEITPIPTLGGNYRVSMKENIFVKLPYRPGDILYVRETWAPVDGGGYIYRAGFGSDKPLWHPSIHMPKEVARIFLRVTDVRVERLQDITDMGILDEGITNTRGMWQRIIDFADLWDSTIKPADLALYRWDANPWVWVIEFEQISKEEAMNDA